MRLQQSDFSVPILWPFAQTRLGPSNPSSPQHPLTEPERSVPTRSPRFTRKRPVTLQYSWLLTLTNPLGSTGLPSSRQIDWSEPSGNSELVIARWQTGHVNGVMLRHFFAITPLATDLSQVLQPGDYTQYPGAGWLADPRSTSNCCSKTVVVRWSKLANLVLTRQVIGFVSH